MIVPYLLPWSSVATFWLKKGVLASLYSEKFMKMQYFHQEGGGRTPGTPYAGSATGSSTYLRTEVTAREFINMYLKYLINL